MKTLPFYKNYFKIPYPLPKIDLIAIPDFAAGLFQAKTNQYMMITFCIIHMKLNSNAFEMFNRCNGKLGFSHIQVCMIMRHLDFDISNLIDHAIAVMH